jgi:hypothetical protein
MADFEWINDPSSIYEVNQFFLSFQRFVCVAFSLIFIIIIIIMQSLDKSATTTTTNTPTTTATTTTATQVTFF